MTKRDIVTLLSPSVFFILAAVAALMTFAITRSHTRDGGSHQKFETFVTNVQSGQWQLTPDRWLEGMRREEAASEAYRQTCAEVGQMLLVVGLAILAGIVFQIVAVYSVRKRLSKP